MSGVVVKSGLSQTAPGNFTITGSLTAGNGGFVVNSSGLPTKSNNQTLAGVGLEEIVGVDTENAVTNAAPTGLTVSPGAAVGLYEVAYWCEVTTATTISASAQVTYKSAGGNSKTDLLPAETGSTGAASTPPVTTALTFTGKKLISIDNSNTNIVVTLSGTFTTCVYNFAAVVKRVR